MTFIGNANIAGEIDRAYFGVDNIAQEVDKGYIGVNNVARLWFSGEVPLELSYTGTMTYEDDAVTGYRYYTLTDSGTLTLSREAEMDVWFCGGGGSGGSGYYNKSYDSKRAGGGGGGGGYFAVVNGVICDSLTVTIGASDANSEITYNSNSKTALKGYHGVDAGSSAGGGGADGGSGGGGGYGVTMGESGYGGGVSTIPFEDSHFTSYPCAGGAGGFRSIDYCGYEGGSNGSNGTTTQGTNGGETGGGSVRSLTIGTLVIYSAENANYYGGGGCGGLSSGSALTDGGSGYQGVCFLRIPLSEFGL